MSKDRVVPKIHILRLIYLQRKMYEKYFFSIFAFFLSNFYLSVISLIYSPFEKFRNWILNKKNISLHFWSDTVILNAYIDHWQWNQKHVRFIVQNCFLLCMSVESTHNISQSKSFKTFKSILQHCRTCVKWK